MIAQVPGTASSPERVVGAIMPYTRSGLLPRVYDGFYHHPNTTTTPPHYSRHIPPYPKDTRCTLASPRQPRTSARGPESECPAAPACAPPHHPTPYTRRLLKQPLRCMYHLASRQRPPSPVHFFSTFVLFIFDFIQLYTHFAYPYCSLIM